MPDSPQDRAQRPDRIIPRRALHDRVLTELRSMISRGELKPGEKVPEKELCDYFNVSRTPLREALKVLAAQGFVSLSLNRGASIARLTQKDMSECFPILASMEALGAELACARATDAEVAAIRALHDDMIEQYERRDLKSYIETNLAIHDAMQEAARNPTHLAIYQSLAARMRPARLMANVTDERWAEAIAEHKAMQAALETRDGPALAAILRKHIGHIHQRVSRVTPPDV